MLFRDLPKEKQGLAVFLSLTQKICECLRHFSIADIGPAEELKIIMDKLDEILQNSNTNAYMAFR